MANRDRRKALQGAEIQTFDLLAKVLTSDQWAEVLRAPLERAAADGNRGLGQKLVGAGAEIGEALHAAIRGSHRDVVNDLLENGASVTAKDANDNTPLHVATFKGKTEMVQLLLLKGADKDVMDNEECTPLYLAAMGGNVTTALALLAAGADVRLRCGVSKRSAVDVAAQGGHLDIIRAAIEHGADVDAFGPHQVTPLHVAAVFDKVKAIDMLVEAGANVEGRNHGSCTPLHFAAGCPTCSLEAVLALLRHGADVNAQNEGQETPLHWATHNAGKQGIAKVVDSLLRSGADETILNEEGKTAADVVGIDIEEEDQLAEGVERVRELLANAPADRAWRRRGYLVLCRAHPDRMRQIQGNSSAQAGMARTTRSGAKMGRTEVIGCGGAVEPSPVDERGGDDWAVVAARVLGWEEEGIFRTIAGYL